VSLEIAAGRLDPDVDAWLRAGAGGSASCERVIETSISFIYLFADRALKLKKSVDLGFLDFSTADKRGWASRRELAFNQPAAPNIYRRVRAITRALEGGLAFDGDGEVLDWAVEMRRFDETATLSNHLTAVDGAFAETLGRNIARYHLQAEPGVRGGGAAGIAYILRSNAHLLRSEAADLGSRDVEDLLSATDAAFESVAPLLDRRLARGFVRCCHGDLHLGNILLERGAPVLFDCIEFNDILREIDVLYDIAFLLMDLSIRDAPEAANRVLGGWVDEAARGLDPSLWEGMAALPLFQAVRAAVRTHVNALEGRGEAARRYLAAGQAYLRPIRPTLIAVGGLSGSGKSTLARALAPDLGRAPGAIILRTDEIRKRLWGRGPTDRLPPEAYAPAAGASVYADLYATAGTVLEAGWSVIADGVFLRPQERAAIEAVAKGSGADFRGLWLDAPEATLRDRVAARTGDASDADTRVVGLQLAQDPGPIAWPRPGAIDVGAGPEAIWSRLGLSNRRVPI
jgi:aminoglycoside phosphotransferase family enzyme/predicted kinase